MSLVYRYTQHHIRHAEEGGITAELTCLTCHDSSGPREVPEDAQEWALKHCGRTAHPLFRRVYEDVARVERGE